MVERIITAKGMRLTYEKFIEYGLVKRRELKEYVSEKAFIILTRRVVAKSPIEVSFRLIMLVLCQNFLANSHLLHLFDSHRLTTTSSRIAHLQKCRKLMKKFKRSKK